MNASDSPRPSALDWLVEAARVRDAEGLHRTLAPRRADDGVLNLASNDYLGLSTDPRVIAGAIEAVQTWGAGATASRLVTGTTALHAALERELAEFLGTASALVFSSGYLANVGVITALMGRGDLIVSDGGAHASLIDGCRLSRARVVVVDRGDHEAVRTALRERTEDRAMVVTDSVYSIDGAVAPVAELYAAAREHGALIVVDEAHALGVRGRGGRGVVDELGLSGAVDLIVTAVLSKSFGSQGGLVAGPTTLRDHLVDRARSFIFDTGLAPAAVGAARAALGVLRAEPDLCDRVRENARRLATACGAETPSAAVVSLIIGEPAAALEVARRCLADGVAVGCFRPPSVPPGTSRIRLTVRADLGAKELDRVAAVVTRARTAVAATDAVRR
ncbi:8-amino-7-oxononanoate synthase [Williamsia maris]|uniref:8-amino-7-oxononanoate synthase n=1 Tax=Williamsia maris TaxID=72806 RepID=A0ABT1HGV6_9NOCA|nr:8-amino-7-oxononanoate synthase [Williamsia maris]MCP2176913.1 8-amino-7-oxononanoate synthase [Williamsia maris]